MAEIVDERVASNRRQSRIIYALLAGLMVLFLLFELRLPFIVGPQSRGLFETVEKLPEDKLALLILNWAPGTYGENYPQTEALISISSWPEAVRHLWGRPVGPTLGHGLPSAMRRAWASSMAWIGSPGATAPCSCR